MANPRTDFITNVSRTLKEYTARSGLRFRTPMDEGLGKFRNRFAPSFDEIDQLPGRDGIYNSMLPLPDRNAKITTVEGDSVHLLMSKLFHSRDEGRLGVLMYLLREDSIRIFLIYQSQSHCMWRVAPSGTHGWFGKTNDQNQLNLPWTFQRLLDAHAIESRSNNGLIHPDHFNYLILQPALYAFYDEMCRTVLLGVTPDLDIPRVQPGAAINLRRGSFSDILEWPTQGCVRRVSFDSLDSELRYHFVVSPYGFGMSSAEERVPFNKYGLRPMPQFVGPMIRPFTDYYQEIDYAFAPVNSHYALRDPVRILTDLAQKIDGIQIVPKEVLHFLNSLRKAMVGDCPNLPTLDAKISARWEEAISSHS